MLVYLQGDIVAILDSAGSVVVQYKYDAWGKPISKTGSMASTLGTVQPFRYRGYVYDEETGLYYLQTRYYDPENVRFLNADIYVSTGRGLLDSNMFAYCRNNPTCREDSSGTTEFDQMNDDSNPLNDDKSIAGGKMGNGGKPGSFAGHPAVPGKSVEVNKPNTGVRYTSDQGIIIDFAKSAERNGGMSLQDAEAMMELCTQYELYFRMDFGHPSRNGFIDQYWHMKIGPVNHVLIYPLVPIH